jgi:potassium efflux system protein
VAGTSGRVDRINIRATTIVNGDNQSMIVPNREFITGNLVNWTYRDRILRIPIRLAVEFGTDPERVVNLLVSIARRDQDVLAEPAPAAALEAFGDSALLFTLSVFVPDPSLAGGVRHRLCSEIQRRFAQEGIVIPLPTRSVHVNRVSEEPARVTGALRGQPQTAPRVDLAAPGPPEPHVPLGGRLRGQTLLVEKPNMVGEDLESHGSPGLP